MGPPPPFPHLPPSPYLLPPLGSSPSSSCLHPPSSPALVPATLASRWLLVLFPMEDQGVSPSLSGCFLSLLDTVRECFLCFDFMYVMLVGGGYGVIGRAVQCSPGARPGSWSRLC